MYYVFKVTKYIIVSAYNDTSAFTNVTNNYSIKTASPVNAELEGYNESLPGAEELMYYCMMDEE